MSTATAIDWTKWNNYLQLYVAEIDWVPHLEELVRRKQNNDLIKNQIACTILLPSYDKSVLTNPPQNLLFWVAKYTQINDRDWRKELTVIDERNAVYDELKDPLLDLGIIDPLEFHPITRQAYNWLIEKAEASPDGCSLETAKKFKNLVYIYGGAVICSVFQKPEWQKKIRNLHNWRTGFFFRQLIHEVYPNSNDIIKIKTMEINKLKNADSKLVRTVKKD